VITGGGGRRARNAEGFPKNMTKNEPGLRIKNNRAE
jgi:hypothetical protein